MRVAAYQASLVAQDFVETIADIREQVERCESLGVEILCCPEGILGGLADYSPAPESIAIDVAAGELEEILEPLASNSVTTIAGFTEIDHGGHLYNCAAVFHRGAVLGVYRKVHPAINRSVYDAGEDAPVFTVGGLTFGIIICLDSTFAEPAATMARQGASVLFVPTNNGLPMGRGGPKLVGAAKKCDVDRATDNGVSVVRADVAGEDAGFQSNGSSEIVDRNGVVLSSANPLAVELIVADVDATPHRSDWRIGGTDAKYKT